MIEYGKILKQRLDDIIQKHGNRGYWIYPFGEGGKLVKSILNIEYGITEKGIIDSYLSDKYPERVYSLEAAKDEVSKDNLVLLTSYRRDLHDELYREVCEKIDSSCLIDIFFDIKDMEKEESEVKQIQHKIDHDRIIRVTKKIDQGELDKYFQYHPKQTSSMFYLPYVVTDFIQQTIFLNDNYFEAKSLNFIFNEFDDGRIGKKCRGGVFVDAGANIGNHSLFFANEMHADAVYAFEAIKETYDILERNIRLNELENIVIPYNYGLGDRNGYASVLNYDYDNIGGSAIMMNMPNDNTNEIKIVTMDGELLGKNKKISFLKIDVEGMEVEVVNGGRGIIQRDLPVIMIESFTHYKELQDFMYPLGYKSFSLGPNDYLFYMN